MYAAQSSLYRSANLIQYCCRGRTLIESCKSAFRGAAIKYLCGGERWNCTHYRIITTMTTLTTPAKDFLRVACLPKGSADSQLIRLCHFKSPSKKSSQTSFLVPGIGGKCKQQKKKWKIRYRRLVESSLHGHEWNRKIPRRATKQKKESGTEKRNCVDCLLSKIKAAATMLIICCREATWRMFLVIFSHHLSMLETALSYDEICGD